MTAKDFTVRWNARNLRAWRTHLGFLKDRPISGLEIGTFEAYTSVWLMDNLLIHPGSTLTCIDPWKLIDERPKGNPDEIYERAVENTAEYGERVKLLRGEAAAVLSEMWEEERGSRFDFVFIDGRHTALDVLLDSANSWRMLRVDGVLVWDDFKGLIRQAVRSFVELFPHEVIWESRRQLCVRKTGTEGE